MQAIELAVPCTDMVAAMRERGVLVNCTADTVLRFLPPLIVTEAEIDEMIVALEAVLAEMQEVSDA
jgi:acetylornithine aminotransferase